MTLLLNSFSLVLLLVGICAEMDDTSFEFVQSCSAAGRHWRSGLGPPKDGRNSDGASSTKMDGIRTCEAESTRR